jgi:hypothetical protein
MREFAFDFEGRYRLPALAFGITPATAQVVVTADELLVRFGPWRLRTHLANSHRAHGAASPSRGHGDDRGPRGAR